MKNKKNSDYENAWECKIGGDNIILPLGADLPMRIAIQKAFIEVTGIEPEYCFSGWGASLTKMERDVVNDEI